MKQVLALPFLLFANAAVADDMAQQFQLHLNSDLGGARSTVKATGSLAYQWSGVFLGQADIGMAKLSESSSTDMSLGLHAGYAFSDQFSAAFFMGWEGIDAESKNYIFHGGEFSFTDDDVKIQLYARKQGENFPAFENVVFGGNAWVHVNDGLTLVGLGALMDNDETDRFTTLIAAGIDYTLPNGLTLSGELATWEKRVNWVPNASGESISLGVKYQFGNQDLLFPDRSTIGNQFGTDLIPVF